MHYSETTTLMDENAEDAAETNINVSVLTLCQTCNTLVYDLNQHLNSSDCVQQIDVEESEHQGITSNSIVLKLNEQANYGPIKVLDDLDGNSMLSSGKLYGVYNAYNLKTP